MYFRENWFLIGVNWEQWKVLGRGGFPHDLYVLRNPLAVGRFEREPEDCGDGFHSQSRREVMEAWNRVLGRKGRN